MQVTVNGEVRELTAGLTIEGLLQQFKVQSVMVAVEQNRSILKKEDFTTTIVQDGDKIEIIRFVGGG